MQIIAAVLAAALSSGRGAADEHRFEVAVRAGAGVPTGSFLVMGQSGTTPRLEPAVPLWIEAGYGLSPALLLGAYLQYTVGRADQGQFASACLTVTNCSGSAHVVRFGGELQYRFLPDAVVVPWIGAGGGYLRHSGQIDFTLNGLSARASGTTSGFDLNLQAGADARLGPRFALGLYGSLFSGANAGVEGGLRARFGL